jgi:hypothetical protein
MLSCEHLLSLLQQLLWSVAASLLPSVEQATDEQIEAHNKAEWP